MSNSNNLKDKSDLELCLHYRKNPDDRFYNEIFQRYKPSVKKQTFLVFNRLRRYGLERDEVYNDLLLILARAMFSVEYDKIRKKETFRFNIIFQQNVAWYILDKLKWYNAAKRKTSGFIFVGGIDNDFLYFQRGYKRYEDSAEDVFFGKELYEMLDKSLDEQESLFLSMLLNRYSLQEIGEKLGINNPYYFSEKLKRKCKKVMN
ncbi:MAG: hypothetical protein GY754_27940 [bacterium]|nr:hypothetical protein [bacterium]